MKMADIRRQKKGWYTWLGKESLILSVPRYGYIILDYTEFAGKVAIGVTSVVCFSIVLLVLVTKCVRLLQ